MEQVLTTVTGLTMSLMACQGIPVFVQNTVQGVRNVGTSETPGARLAGNRSARLAHIVQDFSQVSQHHSKSPKVSMLNNYGD